MRWLGITLILAALPAGCASTKPAARAFPDVVVESWEMADVLSMNQRIDAAVAEGTAWPTSPLSATVELLGGDAETRTVSLFVEGAGEGADVTTVVIVRDGFFNDSVRGDWHRIVYRRGADGTWRVAEARRATRCWRGHHLESYSAQLCP